MKRIIHIVRKEFRQVFRDPHMLRVIFVVPIIQLFILGYAITTDIKNLDLVVCDFDRSSISRDLVHRFSHYEYFNIEQPGCVIGEVEDYLQRGQADLAFVIPQDFGKELETNSGPELQLLVDGQNSNAGVIAMGYANRILLQFMRDRVEQGLARRPTLAREVRMIEPVSRMWYNPELKSVYYMIPGIISVLLLIITTLLTSMAIVKEREIGTLEQLMVTPIKPWQLIAGKTIPFALLGFLEAGIALTFGVLWFNIPVVGSVGVLALLAAAYILTTLGLGILVSTMVSTQQQALFICWFILITSILLSGFFYPIENMPGWVQIITLVDPLRYFIEILRELMLKGAGLDVLWPELLALFIIGLSVFSMAVLRFHKRAA